MIRRRTVLAGMAAAGVPATATAAARWSPCAPVPWPVQEVYGTAWRGLAVIAGGMAPAAGAPGGGINPQDRTGLYDPASDLWREGPRLPFPRHHPALAAAGDQVLAFGGYRVTSEGGWVAIPDALVMEEAGWRPLAPMPRLQGETVAVTLEGRVHLASGRAPRGEANRAWTDQGDVDTHQVFDPGSGRWSLARPAPAARNSAAGAVIDGIFYLAGGRTVGGGNSARLDRYDPRADRWDTLAPMPRGAGGLGGAAAGDRLYVFGGEGGPGVIANAWSYDPRRDAWRAEPDMATPRHGLAGVALQGRIYALGGGVQESGRQVSAVVEALAPA